MPSLPVKVALLCAAFVGLCVSCGGDDDDGNHGGATGGTGPVNTGAVCETADQCYPTLEPDSLEGEALCLEEVRGGYCTHTCESDGDCCAAEGECPSGNSEVCSPFESTDTTMCFLSCEKDDVASDVTDSNEYCQKYASADFICRSSGGGSANRKICVPGDCGVGARCASDADCTGDTSCILGFQGGYCTVEDCQSNDDCPGDSVCVEGEDKNYCFKQCDVASDCSFCRGAASPASCRDDVTFVESGTSGSVCVPP